MIDFADKAISGYLKAQSAKLEAEAARPNRMLQLLGIPQPEPMTVDEALTMMEHEAIRLRQKADEIDAAVKSIKATGA